MAADSGSPGYGERRGNSARGARRGRGGVRAGPGGAARGGLRRRGAGRRCELWRSRKPPRGRDDSLNSPRPPPPPAAGSSRGSRGWRSRGRGRRTAPGRGGERARMPRGRLQGSLRRRIPPQGYAGPGEASRAARRPPGPCVCPAAGGPAGRGQSCPPEEPGGSREGGGEGRRPARPYPDLEERPALPPRSGGARGEALRRWQPRELPRRAGVTDRFLPRPCSSLCPRPGDGATALALLLGEPRERPAGPLLLNGGVGSPEQRGGSDPGGR